jgi:hypothetical protein
MHARPDRLPPPPGRSWLLSAHTLRTPPDTRSDQREELIKAGMPEASVAHVPQVIDTDYYNSGVFAPVLLPNRRTFALVAAFTTSQKRSGWKALLQVGRPGGLGDGFGNTCGCACCECPACHTPAGTIRSRSRGGGGRARLARPAALTPRARAAAPAQAQAYAGLFRDSPEASLYVLLYDEDDVPLRSPNIAARADDLLAKAGAGASVHAWAEHRGPRAGVLRPRCLGPALLAEGPRMGCRP